MGLTPAVASSITGSRSPDEWEAAGKLLASLHQTDVLKVSNQCSPRALLLWQSSPPSLHSSFPPPLCIALSPCSPLHGVKAFSPHGIVGAIFYPSQHSGKGLTLSKLQGDFCAQSCSTYWGWGWGWRVGKYRWYEQEWRMLVMFIISVVDLEHWYTIQLY